MVIDGQSNGEGYWPIDQNVLSVNQSYVLSPGQKWLTPAFDPSRSTEMAYGGSAYSAFHPDKRTGYGVLSGLLHEWRVLNPDQPIGVVNISLSGSLITEHMSGPLYQAGKQQVSIISHYGHIVGRVWVHGESAAKLRSRAQTYAGQLNSLITQWRLDDGQQTPVVIVQLGDNPDQKRYPYWDTIKRHQQEVANQVPFVALVPAGGFKKQLVDDEEGPHYTRESYDTLGDEIATALYLIRE